MSKSTILFLETVGAFGCLQWSVTKTAFWVLLVHFGLGFLHIFSVVPSRQQSLMALTEMDLVVPKEQHSNNCAPTSVPVQDDQWGRQQFELLFLRKDIPGISRQATENGQIIKSLWAFDGQLHMAYGDYDSHSAGPIAMYGWDPVQTRWIDHGLIPSDEVRMFRPGPNNGVLYSPEIDGHGPERETISAVHRLECGESSQWNQMGNPVNGSAHNYNLAVLSTSSSKTDIDSSNRNHKLLVTTGGRTNQSAFVFMTDNQGETWNEVLRVEPNLTVPKSIQRIHTIGVTSDNRIFVSGHDKKTRIPHAYMARYSTAKNKLSSWHPITNLNITRRTDSHSKPPPFLVPVVLHNDMILISQTYFPPYGSYLGSYRVLDHSYELVPEDPWPTLSMIGPDTRILSPTHYSTTDDATTATANKTSYICSAPDSDPRRLLVLVRDSTTRGYGVFRTDSLQKNPVWKQALLLGSLPDHDRYRGMALLRNDLYLGTKHGNIYVVREFYKPADS